METRKIISGSTLKLIACAAMMLDHISKACTLPFVLEIIFDQIIGRIAFPLFGFLLIEGFFHTRSKKRYLLTITLFAILSEIPFNMAIHGTWFNAAHQNTLFTLALGLILLIFIEKVRYNEAFSPNTSGMLQALLVILFCAIAAFAHVDYSFFGILMLAAFYYLRSKHKLIAGAVGVTALNLDYLCEPCAYLSLIPLMLYNGKRGLKLKYFFYLFYPLHLTLLACIRYFA